MLVSHWVNDSLHYKTIYRMLLAKSAGNVASVRYYTFDAHIERWRSVLPPNEFVEERESNVSTTILFQKTIEQCISLFMCRQIPALNI